MKRAETNSAKLSFSQLSGPEAEAPVLQLCASSWQTKRPSGTAEVSATRVITM